MDKLIFPPKPWLIAHRGASAFAPENTLPAMILAKELGANWVEFDVALSKDAEPLIFHDESLERTTNGRGLFAEQQACVLQSLDAGSWFSSAYKGASIPSLAQLLACLAKLNLAMNLEIKPVDDRIDLLVDKVLATLAQEWPAHLPKPLISSFSLEALRRVRALDKNIPLGLLLHYWRADWQLIADELRCSTVHLNQRIVTKKRVAAIHGTQRPVLCYTVNRALSAKRLLALGVDGFFTNDIPKLLQGSYTQVTSKCAP